MTEPLLSTTTIRQIEFELEKAEHGMALPYDAERVAKLRSMLLEAHKQKLSAGLRASQRPSCSKAPRVANSRSSSRASCNGM